MQKFLLSLGICVSLNLVACQANQTTLPRHPKQIPIEKSDTLESPHAHQVICTMQYEPVCATINKNGVISKQTFGNYCSASHAEGKLISTTEGACH